jgi:hypothetical protein
MMFVKGIAASVMSSIASGRVMILMRDRLIDAVKNHGWVVRSRSQSYVFTCPGYRYTLRRRSSGAAGWYLTPADGGKHQELWLLIKEVVSESDGHQSDG